MYVTFYWTQTSLLIHVLHINKQKFIWHEHQHKKVYYSMQLHFSEPIGAYAQWLVRDDLSHNARNRSLGFPTMFDTNQPLQSQKEAGVLKFRV